MNVCYMNDFIIYYFLVMGVGYCHHLTVFGNYYFLDELRTLQTCFSNGVLKQMWLLFVDFLI
jgi:hypothetical protein